MFIARLWNGKDVPSAQVEVVRLAMVKVYEPTNDCAAMEELLEMVSSVWFMLRRIIDHLDKPVRD